MNYKKGVFVFFAIIMCFCTAFLYAFNKQAGKQVAAEWWLVNAYQFKDIAANNIKSRKILVVSGSNSLFSINGEMISKTVGLPVINMGTHAGLDLDYHEYIVKKYMKKGDVVVMPLEYEYYNTTGKPTDWSVNNMTAWGHDYLSSLSLYDYVKFLSNVTPKRLYEGYKSVDKGYVDSIDTVKDRYNSADGSYNGYSYKSLDRSGDINYITNEKTVFDNIENGSFNYSSNLDKISAHSLKVLLEIKSYVKKNNGEFILTWPVSMRNPGFDTDTPETMASLNKIKSLLASSGLDMRCSPSAANLGNRYFMDSAYHTNGYGAKIRSKLLGDCLNTLINGRGGYDDSQNFRAVVLEMESKTPYH